MTIMYLTFGQNIEYHVQAYLSMVSFRKQMTNQDRIVMVTTSPHFYKHASWAEIISIDEKKIEEWQGEYHFFWSAKIMAIDFVGRRYPNDNLLYLDCDTVLCGSIDYLKKMLTEGNGLMDVNEGHPSRMKTKTLRMWKMIQGHTYGGITLGQQHNMYCAGVVGIPKQKREEIVKTALSLCDGMLADKVERVVIEQYSLSVALYEKTTLLETKDCIAHYWSAKEKWMAAAMMMMSKSLLTNASLEEELRIFEETDWTQIPTYVHKSNTARRLTNIINNVFPDRDHRYIKP